MSTLELRAVLGASAYHADAFLAGCRIWVAPVTAGYRYSIRAGRDKRKICKKETFQTYSERTMGFREGKHDIFLNGKGYKDHETAGRLKAQRRW